MKYTHRRKDKHFEQLIWDAYSQRDRYDKVRHQLLRIRELMSVHKEFVKLSAKVQFDFCTTIGCIALHTAQKDLRQLSLTEDKNEVFAYSINEYYSSPTSIPVENSKVLILNPIK